MLYDVAALLIDMLGVLVSYSVTVKEVKLLFSLPGLTAQGTGTKTGRSSCVCIGEGVTGPKIRVNLKRNFMCRLLQG